MKRTQINPALQARDNGLLRVRRITWRVGLLSAAAAAVVGAKFGHIAAVIPHLSFDNGSSSGSSGSGGSSSTGSSSSSGISSSSGVSSSPGGGVTTSGGS